jgi:hypothetical protein
MQSNVGELQNLEQIERLGVQFHLLPAAHLYSVRSVGQMRRAQPLRLAIQRWVASGPIRR